MSVLEILEEKISKDICRYIIKGYLFSNHKRIAQLFRKVINNCMNYNLYFTDCRNKVALWKSLASLWYRERFDKYINHQLSMYANNEQEKEQVLAMIQKKITIHNRPTKYFNVTTQPINFNMSFTIPTGTALNYKKSYIRIPICNLLN